MPLKKIAYSAILSLVLWPTFVFADYDVFRNTFPPTVFTGNTYTVLGIGNGDRLDIQVLATSSTAIFRSIELAICRSTGTSAGRVDLEVRYGATTSAIVASSTIDISTISTTDCGVTYTNATTSIFTLNETLSWYAQEGLDWDILNVWITLYPRASASNLYLSYRDVADSGIDNFYAYYNNTLLYPSGLSKTYGIFIIGSASGTAPISYNASSSAVVCSTFDFGCYIVKGIEQSLTAQSVALSGVLTDVKDEVLYSFPLGILTDTISIMGTTSTTSLPELYIQVPYEFANGQLSGASAILSLDHVLDPLLNATSSYHNDVFAASSVTFYERTEVYWLWLLRIALLLYILRRLFGSHIIPTFWEATNHNSEMVVNLKKK